MTITGRTPATLLATLAVGAAVLGATLAVRSGSAAFSALGVVLAATWIVGAVVAGGVAWTRRPDRVDLRVDVVGAVLLGVAVFAAFVGARFVADHLPLLGNSVDDILERAHAGSTGVVVCVALLNAIGEEMFFRGALQTALGARRGPLWAVVIYAAVTVATLNAALVVAALALGAVLAFERRMSGGVLAPVLTHLTWSALVILFLPR